MGVKHLKKKDLTPRIIQALERVNGTGVEVGVLEGGHGWLASIHEYGCDIPVTEKMRAYLHYQGIHLRQDTKVIRIPERAFLRSGYDSCKERVAKQAGKDLGELAGGSLSGQELCQRVGEFLAKEVRKAAQGAGFAENSPMTVAQKGGDRPLVDTGEMLEGISWRKT